MRRATEAWTSSAQLAHLGHTTLQPHETTSTNSTTTTTARHVNYDDDLSLQPLSRRFQIKSLASSSTLQDSTVIEFETTTSVRPNTKATHTLTLPNLYLRDLSTHEQHVHSDSKQKLFKTTDIPSTNTLKSFGVHELDQKECLILEWIEPLKGFESNREASILSVVPLSTLTQLLKRQERSTLPQYTTWNQSQLLKKLDLNKTFNQVMKQDRKTLEMLDDLLRDGITFVKQVPTDDKQGQHTSLRSLVEKLSSVRNTWYGNLFDVRAQEGSKNIAYTNLDLGLHMDLTHFETPPRYQFLHSLQNKGVKGGSSYFVDSYKVVEQIQHNDLKAFETLTREPLLFEYKSNQHHTEFVRPTIELLDNGLIKAVNYSPPFQGPLPLLQMERNDFNATTTSTDYERLTNLKSSLEMFSHLCDKKEMRFEIQLNPGDCVIFDNRRILHARTSFEFLKDQDENKGRWLKGAYCDGDEVFSLWRILNEKRRMGRLD
ncbi:hypothetical protein OIO90_005903 [Microbotryomycetes sp. JL221]|nr:hypothetical protein OIO90_005903 [Microbotryomycetes sp. JL221]